MLDQRQEKEPKNNLEGGCIFIKDRLDHVTH